MVPINPPKSIFEIFADKLKNAENKYKVKVRWYIMTSEENDNVTKNFFEKNNYFDYGKENIKFFKQAELPLLNINGKILLSDKDKIFMSPNGNGGVFDALHKENIISELKENGIKYLGIGNVDNILNDFLEPSFIGMMSKDNIELGVKTVTKVSPEEKVGVLCKINGRVGVVEYTEISNELANSRDDKGNLEFGEAYFGSAIYDIELLERIIKELMYHVAKKKNSYINDKGDFVISETPNTYKFEMFIFDAFNVADTYLIYSVKREENFAPIKNKEGVDSPETAVKLYNDYYKT